MKIILLILISYLLAGFLVFNFIYPDTKEEARFYLWYKYVYADRDKALLAKAANLAIFFHVTIFVLLMIFFR